MLAADWCSTLLLMSPTLIEVFPGRECWAPTLLVSLPHGHPSSPSSPAQTPQDLPEHWGAYEAVPPNNSPITDIVQSVLCAWNREFEPSPDRNTKHSLFNHRQPSLLHLFPSWINDPTKWGFLCLSATHPPTHLPLRSTPTFLLWDPLYYISLDPFLLATGWFWTKSRRQSKYFFPASSLIFWGASSPKGPLRVPILSML